MNPKTIVTRNRNLIAKKAGNDFIVLDVSTGNLYKLNHTGEIIWKYLWKPRNIKEIAERIADIFPESKDIAEKDVIDFITKYNNSLFFTS